MSEDKTKVEELIKKTKEYWQRRHDAIVVKAPADEFRWIEAVMCDMALLLAQNLESQAAKIKELQKEKTWIKNLASGSAEAAWHKINDKNTKLRKEIERLTKAIVQIMATIDHALGCEYGGHDEYKISDDPKDCSCDAGIVMRMTLNPTTEKEAKNE